MRARRLDDTADNLVAETLEQLLAEEAAGLGASLRGSFQRRVVGGCDYWYYQYRDLDQHVRQIYCGPVGGAWDQVVERLDRGAARGALDRERQAALLRAAGLPAMPAAAGRLIAALADAGLFKAGAMLIGTYAFLSIGNLLGVVWANRAAVTQDVDIAHSTQIELAVPGTQLNLPNVLEGLEFGMHPVPRLDPREPSTSFMFRGKQLRLDLVLPGKGRQHRPVAVPALRAAAQPLPFLDYLLEQPQPSILFGGRVLRVTVPDPARFAIHKLLIRSERPLAEHSKARKDLVQATQLLEVLLEDRPGDVQRARDAAFDRGRNWRRRLQQGEAELPADLRERLES